MKVYVLTYEPYHDNSEVLGVYTTLDAAMEVGRGRTWVVGGNVVPCLADDPPAWRTTDHAYVVQEFDLAGVA